MAQEGSSSNGHYDDDDEYEYEYDETETETFYVNLDLSSYNGPIKPARKRSASTTNLEPEPTDVSVSQAVRDTDPNLKVDPSLSISNRVQIMDLHTPNPIVSYQNQVFTCSWADLVGSEMVFSSPDDHPDIPTLRQTGDFDLVTTSRVKIMGQKANLISASASNRQQQQPPPREQQQDDSQGLGLPPTNQGRFLQRLADVKLARGESDAVRTSFPMKRYYKPDGRARGDEHTAGPGHQEVVDHMREDAGMQGSNTAAGAGAGAGTGASGEDHVMGES